MKRSLIYVVRFAILAAVCAFFYVFSSQRVTADWGTLLSNKTDAIPSIADHSASVVVLPAVESSEPTVIVQGRAWIIRDKRESLHALPSFSSDLDLATYEVPHPYKLRIAKASWSKDAIGPFRELFTFVRPVHESPR